MAENIVEEAKRLLAGIEDQLPLKSNEMTLPSDEMVIATIRNDSGYPFLAVHPESQSMFTAPRPVFDFIVGSPRLVQGLLALIERNDTPDGAKRSNPE